MNGLDTKSFHSPLLSQPPQRQRRSYLLLLLPLTALLAFSVHLLCVPRFSSVPALSPATPVIQVSRGATAGVSEKSTLQLLRSVSSYPWTNNMLTFQRTAFHFQPEKNWMNDPNGPLFYKGWHHLFYQYNPDSAVWGNITWGHSVSRDLINWLHLPIAMEPNRWYDINGVWTGSATILPDGRIVMLYTGSTHESVQVQNLAFPADPTDPLLLRWIKSDEHNPVLYPPPGIHYKDFRDPTTAWYSAQGSGSWLLAIGSKNDSAAHTGIALVYRTRDFVNYELLPGVLHSVPATGMWECVDFYPVHTAEAVGLDTSATDSPAVRHVLKVSLDDDKHDYYAIGRYFAENNSWVPDDPELDISVGHRLDYGKYYASKSFYDENKRRRLLWGWTGETDSEQTDMLKGWASLQTIPRTVLFDVKTGSNLLLWPVEELNSLRLSSKNITNLALPAGSVKHLDFAGTTQLDIMAEFEIHGWSEETRIEPDVGYNCSTGGGAAGRGMLGPFGLLVLADSDRSEQTAVYFYVAKGVDGLLKTYFCHDELRSSNANDIVKRIYGSTVPVLHGETLSVRILIDHSIVESFAQGGRMCITSRVYPTVAIDGAARLFLFNNATNADITVKSLTIWKMGAAFMRPFDPRLT